MSERTKEGKRSFTCCIGPVEWSKIPDGGDSPPRIAAQEAIEKMTGEPVENNWSGWGDSVPPHEQIAELEREREYAQLTATSKLVEVERLRTAIERAIKTLPGAGYLRDALGDKEASDGN